MKDSKSNNCKNKQQHARIYICTLLHILNVHGYTRTHLCVCCITHDKIYFYESFFFFFFYINLYH